MKKLFLILFITLTNYAISQTYTKNQFEKKQELTITYGAVPFEFDIDNFDPFGGMVDIYPYRNSLDFDPITHYKGATYTTGALAINYIYTPTRFFSFGLTLTYSSFFNSNYDSETFEKVGSNSSLHIGIYPKIYTTFINTKKFMLYQSFGLGPGFIVKNQSHYNTNKLSSKMNLAGEFTLLGLKFGSKKYFITELSSIGSAGFFKIGFGYDFTSK